jgi:hypothetical protein
VPADPLSGAAGVDGDPDDPGDDPLWPAAKSPVMPINRPAAQGRILFLIDGFNKI